MEHESIDNGKVFIDILNDDCLRHIFQFLSISDRFRAEGVCNHWRAVSIDAWCTMRVLSLSSSNWGFANPDRAYSYRFIHVSLPKLLQRCGRFLTQLDLSSCYYYLKITKDVLNNVGELCPNLRNLDLDGTECTATAITALAKNSRNITNFTIGKTLHNFDNELSDLLSKQENLEYLEINKNKLKGKCLSFLSASTLRTLILHDCYYIYDDYLSMALKSLRGLEKLIIIKCHHVSKYTFESISKYCINLKILNLQLNDKTITNSLKFSNLVKLKFVRIAFNNTISDDYIISMVLNCQELIYVNIEGCTSVTDAGLASITKLPKLEGLNISHIVNITNEGLSYIRYLKELECSDCELKIEDLSMVLTSSPQLRLLNISKCKYICMRCILKTATEFCNKRRRKVVLKILVGGVLVIHTSCCENNDVDDNGIIDVEVSPFLQVIKFEQ